MSREFRFHIARNGLFVTLPLNTNHSAEEILLWRAVIDKALHDAGASNLDIRKEADSWFDVNDPDFVKVCELAFLDADMVENIYKTKLKKMVTIKK